MAVVTAGALLAGCAQTSTSGGSAAGGPPSTSVSTPPTSGPGMPSTSGPGQAPGGNEVVVRGTLRKGVEAGCLLLDGQDKRAYLLLDGDRSQLRAGTRVQVTGQQVDQTASSCGEGVALSVTSVRPLG